MSTLTGYLLIAIESNGGSICNTRYDFTFSKSKSEFEALAIPEEVLEAVNENGVQRVKLANRQGVEVDTTIIAIFKS